MSEDTAGVATAAVLATADMEQKEPRYQLKCFVCNHQFTLGHVTWETKCTRCRATTGPEALYVGGSAYFRWTHRELLLRLSRPAAAPNRADVRAPVDRMVAQLRSQGFREDGCKRTYDSATGKPTDTVIFTGPSGQVRISMEPTDLTEPAEPAELAELASRGQLAPTPRPSISET